MFKDYFLDDDLVINAAQWFLHELILSRIQEITGNVITCYEYQSYNIRGNLLIKK